MTSAGVRRRPSRYGIVRSAIAGATSDAKRYPDDTRVSPHDSMNSSSERRVYRRWCPATSSALLHNNGNAGTVTTTTPAGSSTRVTSAISVRGSSRCSMTSKSPMTPIACAGSPRLSSDPQNTALQCSSAIAAAPTRWGSTDTTS